MSGDARNMGAWRTPLPRNIDGLHFHTAQQPPRHYAQGGYMANGAGGPPHQPMPAPGAVPLLPNQGRVIDTGSIRILCVADVRGHLRSLNELAKKAQANYIIHTGDFGFYDESSLERIAEKTLKHVAQYSPLITEDVKKGIATGGPGSVKQRYRPEQLPLSELPLFVTPNQGNATYELEIPVYTVWGACEDVRVLEKFRSREYRIKNLHIIDEAQSMLLEVAGVKLRLLGLGGAVVMHKLFDNGEGRTTIAGGQGTMWTTLLQMGELVDTANRVYDPTETRIFVTHASPAREGILNQLSVNLKADFSISAGLHFRYGSSYNEFSVNPTLDHYRGKLAASKASFNDVWETVKAEVEPAIQANDSQQSLLKNALAVVEKMPSQAAGGNPFGSTAGGPPTLGQVDESAFKNMWNFNLADAAFGWLVLEIQDGRIGTEMKAQGFNFSHRGAKQQPIGGAPAAPVTTGPPAGPAQSQPSQRQASQAQPKPSPAPTQTKPLTPAPDTKEKENEKPANGNAHGPDSSAASPAPPKASDIIGLFVMNAASTTDEELRKLFTEADQSKIQEVHKWGAANKVVQFTTTEDRDGALERLPEEYKNSNGDRSKPLIKLFTPRGGPTRDFTPRTGNAGTWGSSRGASSNTGRGSGYQSSGAGGTASDSEGAGRRGGRGGRARGGERGGRGRGRGAGGLKGDASGGNGGSPAPASASPAPAGES
ncbi:hypothetical protein N0V93_002324 [Gnomoniopsis smithogilvyi]|uniref:DUF2433 domain-containing protein n=1 Tax=Gnomoniopsis smithogilvyi TaxID=1191159 RepID=A0A9W9CYW6_9PEZI|nr:hypothetical protein N0V93_002324 [Gnomoniopsis smithogilvyi]